MNTTTMNTTTTTTTTPSTYQAGDVREALPGAREVRGFEFAHFQEGRPGKAHDGLQGEKTDEI